jgi:subtilase family serine protease
VLRRLPGFPADDPVLALAATVRPAAGWWPASPQGRALAVTAGAACVLLGAAGVPGHPAGTTASPRRAGAPRPAAPRPAPAPAGSPGRAAAPAPPSTGWCQRHYGLACYPPRQIQAAYDLPPLYARGLDGRGRTIVVVDSFGSPTIRHDLHAFDAGTGLPDPPSLRIAQPLGPVPRYDPASPDMVDSAAETTTDVEAAHALAPGASLLLVETPVAETLDGGGFPQFMAAENDVITRGLGDVISQSFGLPEQNFTGPAAVPRLRYAFINAQRHHVTVLAAANDFGVTGPTRAGGQFRTSPVVDWPASDPLVTGVGGTRLRLAADGRRTAPDTAWNESGNATVAGYAGALPWAGSGGRSALFARPSYQDPVRAVTGDRRGVPDVALSAAFSGASLTFESFAGGPGRWVLAGGTSVATPYFAGLVAIADQALHTRLGLVNPLLYQLAAARGDGITDITSGSNTVSFGPGRRTVTVRGYPARPGYDLVTGVGTIDAARFVAALRARRAARAAGPGLVAPG